MPMKKKRGRPPLPADERRHLILRVPLKSRELDSIARAAALAGRPASAFVRDVLIRAEVLGGDAKS